MNILINVHMCILYLFNLVLKGVRRRQLTCMMCTMGTVLETVPRHINPMGGYNKFHNVTLYNFVYPHYAFVYPIPYPKG